MLYLMDLFAVKAETYAQKSKDIQLSQKIASGIVDFSYLYNALPKVTMTDD